VSHYYLVASLPTLVMGEPPPATGDDLLVRWANLLTEAELRELALAFGGRVAEGQSDFSKRWTQLETQLRNAVARVRSGKLSLEPREYLKEHTGYDTYIEKAVTDAYARPNPLERELSLDHHRWQLLDELILADRFGFPSLVAFAIKLGIAARWAAMKDEAGQARLDQTLEQMTKV
jgi:hypothetical protein